MASTHQLSPASIAQLPRWARVSLLTATVLLCAIAYSLNLPDPDLWGHVQYANDWITSGHLPRTATHTFTAVGHPWINHENLAELALALGYQWLGMHGLLVGKCALGILLSLLIVRNAERHGASLPVVCSLLLLLAGSLHVFWLLRPQLATFVGLTVWLLIFRQAFRTWHDDRQVHTGWLWCYPFVQLIWTNSHGGFFAGWILMACYTAGRLLDLYFAPLPSQPRAQHRWLRPTALHLIGVTLASLLTMFVNPYGWGLLRWLVGAMRVPRPEIVEWGKPDLLVPMFLPYFALLLGTALAWLLSLRHKDWVHGAILMLLAWQSLSHIRHIGLFVIVTAFWSVGHFEELWLRIQNTRTAHRWHTWWISKCAAHGRARRWGAVVGCAAILTCVLSLLPLAQRVAWLPVDRTVYPVDAIGYMQQHRLQGKLVVSFNWAQYAIAALQPRVEVAFDGRFRTCYPQSLIDMHFDLLLGDVAHRYRSELSGPVDPMRVLHHGNPDLVLLDQTFPHSIQVMQQQDTFVLLYQDGVAQLWGRRTVYDDPQSTHYVPHERRSLRDTSPAGSVPWPALVHGGHRARSRHFDPRVSGGSS